MPTDDFRRYLIMGRFYQRGYDARKSDTVDNDQPVPDVFDLWMFNGVIWTDEDGGRIGKMRDRFGESVLTNIDISDKTLTFTKQYQGRHDLIHYSFKANPTPHDGMPWVGNFQIENRVPIPKEELVDTVSGPACCVLIEVNQRFFSNGVLHYVAELMHMYPISNPR